MALAPQAAYFVGHAPAADALLVSTLETSSATLPLGDQAVGIEQQSEFPSRRQHDPHAADGAAGHICRPRSRAPLGRAAVADRRRPHHHGRRRLGRAAGPEVDWRGPHRRDVQSRGAADRGRIWQCRPGGVGLGAVHPGLRRGPQSRSARPCARWASRPLEPPAALDADGILKFRTQVVGRGDSRPKPATFVTFADAGATGGIYRVWLRAPGVTAAHDGSLLADGEESRSRPGNVLGSIVDGDAASFVVTYNGRPAQQDWFAVALDRPVSFRRVVFAHGKSFHDGGWFDASAGKPQVQVQRKPHGAWERIGLLAGYPPTTATSDAGLKPGQSFTLCLPGPVSAVAVRVLGVPACGDSPKQAFSSCGELQAFDKD